MITAFTEAIDEADIAIAEIRKQLAGAPLLRHSAGIIHCHEDFLQAGVVRDICAGLPFDVIGCTVMGAAVPGAASPYLLTLTVLTSDDIVFAAGVSEPLRASPDEPLERLYARILAALPGKPSLCLLYGPFLQACAGGQVLQKLTALAGNVPFFGMRAINESRHRDAACVLYNGGQMLDSVAVLAMYGGVEPVFLLANREGGRVFNQRATVTEADGNLLKQVNGVPALDYFSSLGLIGDNTSLASEALLFLVKPPGRQPMCRVFMKATEEGHIVCGGNMPAGAELQLEIMDAEGVISSARTLVARALRDAPGKNMLLASCVLRNWALGVNELEEMKTVAKYAGQSPAWHFAYTGGEICPVRDAAGRWTNCFHNATLAICLL
jgi:hypothetical protein